MEASLWPPDAISTLCVFHAFSCSIASSVKSYLHRIRDTLRLHLTPIPISSHIKVEHFRIRIWGTRSVHSISGLTSQITSEYMSVFPVNVNIWVYVSLSLCLSMHIPVSVEECGVLLFA